MNVVILGGGLAGLSCAYELSKDGHRATVLERESWVGGMAASHQVEGYWIDHGPHRFHSYNQELIDHLYEVMDGELHTRDRLSRIYMRKRFFDYPLKLGNVIRNMPPHIMAKAFLDYFLVRVRNAIKPIPDDCFENWVTKRFGKTLYRMFFGTYTEKAWKMSAKQISADWASQRITLLNLWDTVKKTVFRPKNTPRTLVSKFWYPTHGGIGTICRKYAEKVERQGGVIHLGTPVKNVVVEDGVARAVTFELDGVEQRVDADLIVSTIPLPILIRLLQPAAPEEVHAAISRLEYVSIVFAYLEVDKPSLSPDHWIYLPEKHLTVHRISEFKNFSENVAPHPDKTVVCCEMTCRFGDEIWEMDIEQATKTAERDLITVGLLEPGQCRGIHLARLRFAYPVYDLEYRENLQLLIDCVKGIDRLDTSGRQGLYRYNNMDHSVAMGRTVANALAKEAGGEDHTRIAAGKEYFG